MPVRGRRNPFPQKMKPTTNVFSSPQKMDPPPRELAKARSVMEAALKHDRKDLGGGKSAKTIQTYAHRGPRQR